MNLNDRILGMLALICYNLSNFSPYFRKVRSFLG